MLFENDNLNDLFKKAARDYPLKTDNSNWEQVNAKLNKPFLTNAVAKNKALKYAMVMLVLVLALSSLVMYKFTSVSSPAYHVKEKDVATENKPTIKDNTSMHINQKSLTKTVIAANLTSHNNKRSGTTPGVFQPVNSNNNSTDLLPAVIITNGNEHKYSITALVDKRAPSYSLITVASKSDSFNAGNTNDRYQEKVLNEIIPAVKQDVVAAESISKTPKRLERSNSFYKIYGSLYAGPEFSMVKLQQINKPGYKIGVSIGFRLNHRFNIELGLQREHINFYSAGKYLDTSMLKIKSNVDVENVNARSKLTSVPLAIRYNFHSKSQGHFFVTAGINAVIITHSEQYQYSVSKDGVPADLSKYYNALTPPKYFSGVNASAGYEFQLPKLCSMKVESYYQSPVNNLGVGQLPVTSFGINVGIVKNLK